jgi:uncharacterized protein YjbI with pentapeptide repeats
MKKMSQAELDRVLEQHKLWLQTGGAQGARAYLYSTNLSHADLSGADLSGAYLSGASLTGADLTGANLTYADLLRANLSDVNLSDVDLSNVYLYQANLSRAQISAGTRLHQCSGFRHLTCSPGALPWLILHPRWSDWKSTVTVVEDEGDNPK